MKIQPIVKGQPVNDRNPTHRTFKSRRRRVVSAGGNFRSLLDGVLAQTEEELNRCHTIYQQSQNSRPSASIVAALNVAASLSANPLSKPRAGFSVSARHAERSSVAR